MFKKILKKTTKTVVENAKEAVKEETNKSLDSWMPTIMAVASVLITLALSCDSTSVRQPTPPVVNIHIDQIVINRA